MISNIDLPDLNEKEVKDIENETFQDINKTWGEIDKLSKNQLNRVLKGLVGYPFKHDEIWVNHKPNMVFGPYDKELAVFNLSVTTDEAKSFLAYIKNDQQMKEKVIDNIKGEENGSK